MSSTRRSRLAASLLVGLVATGVSGCGGASVATPPSSPVRTPSATASTTTPSPSPSVRASTANDVALTGVDACALLTPATLAAGGLGSASVIPGLPPEDATSACTAKEADGAAFTVYTYPSTSLEGWQELFPAATTTTVAGYPGATALDAPTGERALCRIAAGTAPSATLEVDAFILPELLADHDACGEASVAAAAVVATLQATR